MTAIDTATTDPFDHFASAIARYTRQGELHRQLAGSIVKGPDEEGFTEQLWNYQAARSFLAVAMMLRHVRRTAPELLDDLLDLGETASLLTEFGMAVKLDRYLKEVGGHADDIHVAVEMVRPRKAT